MQQKLNISVFVKRVSFDIQVIFEVQKLLMFECKVRIMILRVECEGIILAGGYPNNSLLEK